MKTFVVLGMHRSATSLIAKGLHDSGVDMGIEVLNANEHNPNGYYENWSFVRLNDKILGLAGGSWFDPPTEKRIMDLRHIHRLDEMIKFSIKHYGEGRELWGWKDPRTCLTIRLYEPYLVNPHYILCFRDNASVAKSLAKRGDVDYDKALLLAEEYNRRLKSFADEFC